MWQQRAIILAALGVLAGLAIPLLVYRQIRFIPPLKQVERSVAEFKPTTLVLPRKEWQQVTLTAPVTPLPAVPSMTPIAAGAQAPPAAVAPSAPLAAPTPVVSFILHDGGKDMAIINGNVLKAGDRFQEWRVERIERNRVLLSSRKGPLWIALQ